MSESLINSAGLLALGAVFTFFGTWFWTHRKDKADKADKLAEANLLLLSRVSELEGKLALINQAVIPISTAFQAILIKELTHYHTPEMDALMRKVGPPSTLTEAEEERLAQLLLERTTDMGDAISDSERDAAMILPAVMRRARIEASVLTGTKDMGLKLVTVAAVVGLPVTVRELTAEEQTEQHEAVTSAPAVPVSPRL